MELWIRSQDRTKLCKIHNLCVRENQNENNETNYVIQDIFTMGTYKTKERALEVLDEIQKALHIPFTQNTELVIFQGRLMSIIYEMPNE